jgi:hypothetical protein
MVQVYGPQRRFLGECARHLFGHSGRTLWCNVAMRNVEIATAPRAHLFQQVECFHPLHYYVSIIYIYAYTYYIYIIDKHTYYINYPPGFMLSMIVNATSNDHRDAGSSELRWLESLMVPPCSTLNRAVRAGWFMLISGSDHWPWETQMLSGCPCLFQLFKWGVKMGQGKGNIEFFVARVPAGRVMFKMLGGNWRQVRCNCPRNVLCQTWN